MSSTFSDTNSATLNGSAALGHLRSEQHLNGVSPTASRSAHETLKHLVFGLTIAEPHACQDVLDSAAFEVGRLVGHGFLDCSSSADALTSACTLNGLTDEAGPDIVQEAIAAGFLAGAQAAKVERASVERYPNGESIELPDRTPDLWRDRGPDWSLLDDRRGELPEFPIDFLPAPWRQLLEKVSHGAGVTPAHVMVPLLSVASSLVGTARRVRASSSWSEPLSTWTAVVGFSGTGKTPGLDVTKRALSRIERARKDKIGELQRAHEKRVETAKAAAKKWKAEVQEAVEAGIQSPTMPPEAVNPGEFVAPRLYASDATIERLAVLLQARPSGITMICDELAGLFLNMGRYSNGSDREFWLEAYNGGHYVVERQGRAPVALDHLLIGMTGGFQPDKLARSFEGDDDGLYARVLFGWPKEPEFRRLSNAVAEVEPVFQTALMRLIELAAETEGVVVVRHVPLAADATETFEQFRHFLHAGKAALDGREREWWAKGGTHVLRLAGTLCYLHWSMTDSDEPGEVGPEFVAGAVQLWKEYFWPHARAALRQVGLTDRHANARRVLRWLRAHRKTEVSVKDARRDALSQRVDAEQTEAVLSDLERAGWLHKTTEKTLGRPVHRWAVNPALLSPDPNAGTAGSAGGFHALVAE